jgi:hypothetical protein
MKTDEIYAMMRTGWLLAIIPIVLGTGPLAGWLIGDILVKKAHLPSLTMPICVILGLVAGVQETVKIIRIALNNTKTR